MSSLADFIASLGTPVADQSWVLPPTPGLPLSDEQLAVFGAPQLAPYYQQLRADYVHVATSNDHMRVQLAALQAHNSSLQAENMIMRIGGVCSPLCAEK